MHQILGFKHNFVIKDNIMVILSFVVNSINYKVEHLNFVRVIKFEIQGMKAVSHILPTSIIVLAIIRLTRMIMVQFPEQAKQEVYRFYILLLSQDCFQKYP